MPVEYDLPEYQGADSIEDVNKYNKLPFYLAKLEAEMFPTWQVYNRLFGKINWKPNMGPVIRGVRAEHTPIGQSEFFPVDLQQTPNKNVYETLETSEDAALKWHDFDSKLFHFLPSFQDFRENQLSFNHKDIVRQIAIANDLFIRTAAIQKAPYIYVCGAKNGDKLTSSPVVPSGTSITSANAAKNTAFWEAQIARVGSNLSLAELDYLTAVFRDDLNAPFFEGVTNSPRDNDLIKGRYVAIGSLEAFQQFKWDPDFAPMRNVNLSIVNDGFRGSIFDEITWKAERYPLRIAADGTRPFPELVNESDSRTRPNPDYVKAEWEVMMFVGADAFKTINVGPPPSEFSAKAMSREKFYSMKWNGEVQLTDQVLVQYADGQYDTNVRGRFLKLISTAIMGMIPCNQYNYLPVLFKRKRPGSASAA